jgi:hypothetical protein
VSINLTGQNVSGINFGNSGTRTISGIIFNDSNGNGAEDAKENGLAGWLISLVMQNGTLNVTNATGPSGSYSFDHLPPGIYNLSEVLQHGWAQTLPLKGFHQVNVTVGNVSGVDFGNRWALSISGTKFNDTDGNGIWDAGEPGLAGWVIYLERPAGKTLATNTTAIDGKYGFLYLTPGEYTLREVSKPGWNQTVPDGGRYSVDLTADSVTDKDFGDRKIK